MNAITNNLDGVQPNRPNGSVAFTYDPLNRLASAHTLATDCTVVANSLTKNWGQNFTYDAWGNLYSIAVERCSVPTLSAAVDPATNRLTGNGYAYGGAGNMLNDGGHAYTYDAEGRIATAAGVTYTYDGDGKRVKKSTGKLYWTGMGSDPLDESDLSGNVNEEYVFFNGQRVARLDLPTAVVHYYFADHLGSASVVTNADGTVIQDESDYYPFGGERAIVTSDPNAYKFTGKERDTEDGLDYFGARYYASTMGRWTSPDWAAKPESVPYAKFADPQSLNLYSYVRNTPTSKADGDGHCPGDDCSKVTVEVTEISPPKVVQNEKQEDGTYLTGVRAKVQETITVNGKPLADTNVDEKNVNKVTLNGKPRDLDTKEGPAGTNNAGQLNDTVGLLAPARTAEEDMPLINILNTQAVSVTNTNTITFTTPSGDNCTSTTTRTLTNVGPDGTVNSTYALDKGQPVVGSAEPPKEKQPK